MRRSLSIIVMLAFVIGQMTTFPHAHADGQQPADHNARPHIHVALLGHGSHSHDDEDCHHHNGDGSHSQSPSPAIESEQDGHDSDAVYLPNDIGVSLQAKSVTPLDNYEISSTLAISVVPSTISVADCIAGPLFPGECNPICPLWLSLRALRL